MSPFHVLSKEEQKARLEAIKDAILKNPDLPSKVFAERFGVSLKWITQARDELNVKLPLTELLGTKEMSRAKFQVDGRKFQMVGNRRNNVKHMGRNSES